MAEVYVKWSEILMDRLGPHIFSTLRGLMVSVYHSLETFVVLIADQFVGHDHGPLLFKRPGSFHSKRWENVGNQAIH